MTERDGAVPFAAPSESPGTVVGNYHCKYQSRNPAIRWLTTRWLDDLERLMDAIATERGRGLALEVGCGEGEIAGRLRRRWDRVTALDLPDAGLRQAWRRLDGVRFVHADAERLPLPAAAFDVVVSVEVLEHLRDPEAGLREMARVSRRHLLLSVPREPVFRLGNLAAGRYVRALGNTPGHLNHWSTPGFVRFVSQIAAVREVRTPLPWTIVWARLR